MGRIVNANAQVATVDDGLDLLALWSIVWSRKYLVIASSFVCALIAVVLALTATEMYRADTVLTEAQSEGMGSGSGLMTQLGGLAGLAGISLGELGGSHESKALLKSRRLVEEFIKRENLLPQLFPHPNAQRPPTVWFAVEYFRREVLSIREDNRNFVTTVSVRWTDPAVAAAWSNGLVRLANELMRDKAMQEAKRNITYLNAQVAQTDVVEVKRVMYSLVESETKKLMLANARADYAFAIVDPAVTPELRVSPKRTLMVILGATLGGILGLLAAFVLHALRLWRAERPAR
jgi:uncharacterized protein involved in exopolysaccharide biosynthesis